MANQLAELIRQAERQIAKENSARNALKYTSDTHPVRNALVGGGALGAGTAGGYYGVGVMTQSDDAYAQSLLNARRNAIPSAFRGQEQGLEAPMFSPDDLIGTGLISKVALLAGAGITKAVGKNTLAKMLKRAQPEALENVARTADQYIPLNVKPNKYQINPDFNSRYKDGISGEESGQIGGLATPEQYRSILNEQAQKAQIAKTKWEQDIQHAIDVDARRAAERRNIQPTAPVLSDEEWLKQWEQAGGASNRSVRQDIPYYGQASISDQYSALIADTKRKLGMP